jgi:hypothetical protein
LAVKEAEEKKGGKGTGEKGEGFGGGRRRKELEKIRRVNQARIREAEELRAEARRRADEEDRIRRLQEEHDVRLRDERRLRHQERQARVEAEWIACLERERVSRLEEEARLAREREEQRLEKRNKPGCGSRLRLPNSKLNCAPPRKKGTSSSSHGTQAQASQRLDGHVKSILDPEMLEGANQRFEAQQTRFREQLEEAARAQAAASSHWFYVQPEHYWQQHSIHLRIFGQTSFRTLQCGTLQMSISMYQCLRSLLLKIPFRNQTLIGSICTRSRWQELRGPNEGKLAFPSFPWPVFQHIRSLDELADEDIKRFFASKYPGELDKNWKLELTRWHPDKVERLRNRIRQDCVEFVQMGFLRCTMIMNAFQEASEHDFFRELF